jgi:hypothetical protein
MRRVRIAQASDWDLVGDLVDEAGGPMPNRRVSLKVIAEPRETRWQ